MSESKLGEPIEPKQMLPHRFRSAIRYLPYRLILRFARRFTVEGVQLLIFLQDRDRADNLRTKIAAALELIQVHSPKCYARVRQFIPRILIFGAHPYGAEYISKLKLCDISRHYALSERASPRCLALTLVHEATHGYLDSLGFIYEEKRRAQIERICIRTEIALARKLPDSDTLIAEMEAQLAAPADYWKNEAFFDRDLEHLKALGTPRWLVALLRKKRPKRGQSDGLAESNQTIRS